MVDLDKITGAIDDSLKLWQSGKHKDALRLLDNLIAVAIKEGANSYVATLSHHAAIIAGHKPDIPLVKHYYEQSLMYKPENPMALHGLAQVALKEGQTEKAKQYAKRCYQAILQSDDEI